MTEKHENISMVKEKIKERIDKGMEREFKFLKEYGG